MWCQTQLSKEPSTNPNKRFARLIIYRPWHQVFLKDDQQGNCEIMMATWHGNVFSITVPLCRESAGGVPWQRVNSAELWSFVVTLSIFWHSYAIHHDDVIKWKHFPRNWQFVRGIHRSQVNSPHKGQWRGALMFSLIWARINGWVSNCEAGDLSRIRPHYYVTVMTYLLHHCAWGVPRSCVFFIYYSSIVWCTSELYQWESRAVPSEWLISNFI